MKNQIGRARLLMAVGAVSWLPVAAAFGADTNSSPAEAASDQAIPVAPQSAAPVVGTATAAAETAPGKLPYGVADVLKLTQAQVSEDVVLNYVLNAGTVYNLGPKDIIYLRNQGVSDRVITTMMNQRNRVAEESAQQAAAQAASQPQGPFPVYSDPNAAPGQPLYAPAYVEPPPAPEPAPSTVYVVPFTPGIAPYYPYYGGYYAPGVSFVYGFGRGAYHRGYYHGGHYHYGRAYRR
ncbi:MAG: hypothetical protein ABSH34_10800 [Verrucomicrobiota bacterium]|jgi:hypothetical protein